MRGLLRILKMMGNDGVDDVIIMVNASLEKLMGLNILFGNCTSSYIGEGNEKV